MAESKQTKNRRKAWEQVLEELQKPFQAEELQWRVQGNPVQAKGGGYRVCLVPYVSAPAIIRRLNQVFGIAGWRNEHHPGPSGGVKCRITFRVWDSDEKSWVWTYREDGADETKIEAVKGGMSGALKRAARMLEVGLYLYELDAVWCKVQDGWPQGKQSSVDIRKDRKRLGWAPVPQLPHHALPHHTSFDANARRWWFAQLSDLGLTKEEVDTFFIERHGRRPSQATEDQRRAFIRAVVDKRGGEQAPRGQERGGQAQAPAEA